MLFGVGASCRNLSSMVIYLYVSCSGSITSIGEERANLSAEFTCNYVVSVRKSFLFLTVLGMGCVILLWHSLSLPYNYFASPLLSFIWHQLKHESSSNYPCLNNEIILF